MPSSHVVVVQTCCRCSLGLASLMPCRQQPPAAAASCTPEQSGEHSCDLCKQHCNALGNPAASCSSLRSLQCSSSTRLHSRAELLAEPEIVTALGTPATCTCLCSTAAAGRHRRFGSFVKQPRRCSSWLQLALTTIAATTCTHSHRRCELTICRVAPAYDAAPGSRLCCVISKTPQPQDLQILLLLLLLLLFLQACMALLADVPQPRIACCGGSMAAALPGVQAG
jgi:hypothetical protein